jgi:hypothetical protein
MGPPFPVALSGPELGSLWKARWIVRVGRTERHQVHHKRATLAQRALQTGVVSPQDLAP